MKILHTADWHIGNFRGPEKNGINLRAEDTIRCLEEVVRVAMEERPELVLVSGDVFHQAEIWQGRSHRELHVARSIIKKISEVSGKVIVMRGTPNHDAAEIFMSLTETFERFPNVKVVTQPQVVQTEKFDVAVLPGFDVGSFRAKHPGLSKEEESATFTNELSNIVFGLRAQCSPSKNTILMSHYTVPGCNTESGQTMMLTHFEPVLTTECLNAAAFDLVALGHIHRPQEVPHVNNCYYSGAINAMNFNDEGQERGFWIHYCEDGAFGKEGMVFTDSRFFRTPYREFMTYHLTDADIAALNSGNYDEVAFKYWRSNGSLVEKIVRIHYSCSYENSKGLNTALLERQLLDDGAFMVKEILSERTGAVADRTDMSGTTDPEENLRRFLDEKHLYTEEKIQELILKARPIIAEAAASISTMASLGTFEPVEIAVKNYRNYEEENFNFENISFCTINGQNGAGKSSLFMDAIIDCLYEEPRENELIGWICNDEKVRSGSIMFTFRIGEKLFRVTRTRTKSGRGTLNLSELVDGEWVDRSKEKQRDTQTEIINLIGMDSMTFKSCALIMQDQYGLFLQAPKEDRMVILGNLLGLGIYEAMNKIAGDRARVFKAKTQELKHEMEIHNATIMGYGDPVTEIKSKQDDLKISSDRAKKIVEERDKKNSELLSMQETQERCNRMSEAISALRVKKASAETNRETQTAIINNCKAVLETEQMVTEKAERYRILDARKKELIEEAALFCTKQEELDKATAAVYSIRSERSEARTKLQEEQERLAVYEDSTGDDEILRKAEEYQTHKDLLDGMQMLALKYQEAEQKVQKLKAEQTHIEQAIGSLDGMIGSTRSFLGKDIAILSNSGCIDIEKAGCKFLEKAKASKDELQREEEKYRAKREALEAELTKKKEIIEAAIAEQDAVGYEPEKKANAERQCAELRPYIAKAEQVRKKAGEIKVIKVSIENIQTNLSAIEKRLTEAETEMSKAHTELERYRGAFDESIGVTNKMKMLAPWIEQENQIPVIRERFSNAMQRLEELELQISEMDKELSDKELELSQEMVKTEGLAEKQEDIKQLNVQLETIEGEKKVLQMSIGALTQKLEQIDNLREEITVLQDREREAAKETADYETLKVAFSQDGIPHQIIRSIIPVLTATANTILGQMTGGKMGIEFKTEKMLKNKKEVVSLDIYIEEYGKPALPYLSKSGGEKVKASLSAILALSEIKSSSAGIQLGMLFIDEPPFLDADGIQAYCDALETIQQRYPDIKIMAITHDPTMKARFPQNLDVVKTEHGSKVIY